MKQRAAYVKDKPLKKKSNEQLKMEKGGGSWRSKLSKTSKKKRNTN